MATGTGMKFDPLRWGLLAVPVAVVLIAGYLNRSVIDDGFIYLRIVQNLSDGHGPVFNVGERVEAYTSPLWVALLAIANVIIPAPLEWIAVIGGLALSAAGVVLAMTGALRLTSTDGDDQRIAVPVGALVFVAPFGVWAWFTAGMETGLVFAWLGLCCHLLARWATDDTHPHIRGRASAVLGLGILVRPELVVFSGLMLVVVLALDWPTSSWRRRVRTVVTFAAVPVLYQIFRMGYFGLLVANTALAKEGTSTHWDRGVIYLRDFIDPYHLWIPILILALAGYLPALVRTGRRQRAVIAVFAAGGTLMVLYVIAVGGDYLHARLFLPGLFILCAPVAAVHATRRNAGLALLAPWVVLALASFRPPQLGARAFAAGTTVLGTDPGRVRAEYGWGDRQATTPLADTFYLASSPFVFNPQKADVVPKPGLPVPSVALSGIGETSYALGPDVHVVDILSLAHPVGSHLEPLTGLVLAGHEKLIPNAWIAAFVTRPGTPVDASTFVPLSKIVISQAQMDRDRPIVRRLMMCPTVGRLDAAANDDLPPELFVKNFFNAPRNTRVRIPRDPAEAVAKLC